jgi:hypothetical protein
MLPTMTALDLESFVDISWLDRRGDSAWCKLSALAVPVVSCRN